MAARVGLLRTVHAVRGLCGTAVRQEVRCTTGVNYLSTVCKRCLSTGPHIFQKLISKDHEWVKVDNGIGTVGITNHAQELLGDLVYVELPEVDDEFDKDETVGVVESVKAASDVMTPLTGIIVAVNENLKDSPETVNKSPEDEGWLFQIHLSEPDELDELMSEEQYQEFLAESEG